jgi:hypothetical protein
VYGLAEVSGLEAGGGDHVLELLERCHGDGSVALARHNVHVQSMTGAGVVGQDLRTRVDHRHTVSRVQDLHLGCNGGRKMYQLLVPYNYFKLMRLYIILVVRGIILFMTSQNHYVTG